MYCRDNVYHLRQLQKEVMPGFRWSVQNDILLCNEVCRLRPRKTVEWEEVAKNLNQVISTGSAAQPLKERGCRERLRLLSKKYANEDRRSLKRLVILCCFELANYFCVTKGLALKKSIRNWPNYSKTFGAMKEI